MSTVSIAGLEEAEFKLVDALWRLPLTEATAALRRQCQEVLDRLRARKATLLEQHRDVLRKSAISRHVPVDPRRRGLPSVEPEVAGLVKAARDRQAEERRLSKRSGQAAPGQNVMAAMKGALRQPIFGNRALTDFLTRRAGR